ncbi:MAG: FtsX-like permease family protein [bacterium]
MEAILAAGTRPDERGFGRYTGSPGFYRTEALILGAFRDAGLEVQTQEFEVTVPVTEYCEILDETGRPLEGVQLYPFMPAGLQPTALPPEGIKADLVVTENLDVKYLSGHDPSNTIVLTYLDSASDWVSLAGIGVQAVIVREDDLAKRLRDSPDKPGLWKDLAFNREIEFPRFVVRGPLDQWAGKALTVRCKVTWQTRKVRNILGRLRGADSAREALVLSAYYDSYSLVPELAPGAEQSLSLAALLEYAHALAAYRGQLKRDVIFVATAAHSQSLAGASRLLEALETYSTKQPDHKTLEQRRLEQETLLASTRRALDVLAELARATELPQDQRAAAFTRDRWLKEDRGFRRWFEENFTVVSGEIDLDNQESALAAKLDHQRAGSPVYRDGFNALMQGEEGEKGRKDPANTHPLLAVYLAAQKRVNRSANLMAMPLWKLADYPEFAEWDCAGKAAVRFKELGAYHEQKLKEIDDLIAVRRLFETYKHTLTINLEFYSGGEKKFKEMAALVGISALGEIVEPQSYELAKALTEKIPLADGKPAWKATSWGRRDADGGGRWEPGVSATHPELESEVWHCAGRQAFTVVNREFFPPKVSTPEDTLDGVSLDVLHEHVPAVGRALLAIAFGRVPFKTIEASSDRVCAIRGTVYTSAGSASLVPTHPVTVRTFVHPYREGLRDTLPLDTRGVLLEPVVAANPYGAYERAMVLGMQRSTAFNVNAARFDQEGRIVYFKDGSSASQLIYRNEGLSGAEVIAGGSRPPKAANVVVFRCAPVALYDRGNPRTLKSFHDATYLDRMGLSGPLRSYRSKYTDFLPVDFRFYVGYMDGALGNKEITEYRAFMLNVDPNVTTNAADESELFGRGYLANTTPNLTFPHIDAAASMLRTADKRLALQQRYGMADEQMLAFHERGKEWLADARSKLAAREPAKAMVSAGTSLAYAINNHPVIRNRISQAVVGILWYLALLVPFVFFAEKLIFGFADIRRQLLASGIIFLLVFVLLRLFHPAFQMVRSSLVILLGFIIFLLTLMVTMMVGGKFRQNIKDLRSKEGRVEGADINRAGVVGTAFMLGLNNMRRRKVRTGLTCVTLILITFVMICFTSVSTDLKNVEYPTGRAEWNGIMLRNQNFVALDPTEVANLQRIYGSRYPVTVWSWLVTKITVNTVGSAIANPEFQIDREFKVADITSAKRVVLNGCVAMEWNEPLFSGIDRCLVTTNGWFPAPPRTRAERLDAVLKGQKEKNYIMLPETAAAELGLSPADVDGGGTNRPVVKIRGMEFEVLGILNTEKMSRMLGLDGRSILPYDLNSVQSMGSKGTDMVIPEDAARLNPRQVMIVNRMPPSWGELDKKMACLILFPKTPYSLDATSREQPPVEYREQRRTVLEYLERIGEPGFYAIDGVSYYGSRQRAKSFAGLLELLVPILIAALTVFNTMRGSVYERKDEIYVYNAVGVAPNHVFFIFMAEACVYAVVGALMGYILSQGTGRLLTVLGMTGGLNMDYSSIETIYASLAIMAATLLSTVLPARDAARMASPADTVHWTVPQAQGDEMKFNLPFTFTAHDRIAVVSYFHQWLDANGAGSSGSFYCSPPEAGLRTEAGGPSGSETVPTLTTTIWLKPYDLGVSQRLEISLPTDPETAEYIARITITRLSGHVTTWERRVKPFLGTLRKQFLNWRVTTEVDRTKLFAEAKRLLQGADGHSEKKEV